MEELFVVAMIPVGWQLLRNQEGPAAGRLERQHVTD
jgi:hypothetical protein